MQSTSIPGSSLCGAILADGTDCPNLAHEEAPINLCIFHLVEAATWVNQNDESTRPRELCPVCGEREARVEGDGLFCGRCWFQSPEFVGRAVLTPAEEDETNPRAYGNRPVNVVYYVRFGERIKIGTTKDPRKRLTAIPHDEVLAFELGGAYVEASRHIEFREHRIRNTEWFHVAQPLLDHIATLQEPGISPWETYRRMKTHRDTPTNQLAG